MLKILLKNQKFLTNLSGFLRENTGVLDIIIFVSFLKGKKKPADIDILLLFKDKEDLELEYALRKILENVLDKKIEITSRAYKNLFDPGFLPREFILSEGYSFKLKRFLSEAFGYKSYVIFNFSLAKFGSSKRTLFHYALHGRKKGSGVLRDLGGLKLSGLLLIPVRNSEKFKAFLERWGIEFKKSPILIPERAIKYKEI